MQYLITEQGGFGKVVNYDYVGHYEYNSTEHRITLSNVILCSVELYHEMFVYHSTDSHQ